MHARAAPEAEDFHTQFMRQMLALAGVIVRYHDNLGAQIRYIAGQEPVDEGDGQNAVVALHGADAVNKTA